MAQPRHSWNEKITEGHKSIRSCRFCDIVKVTHHEIDGVYITFERDGSVVSRKNTPACVPVEERPQAGQ